MALAKHRLEVATDLVCDIKTMKDESEGIKSETGRGKKISPLQVKETIRAFHLFDKNGDKSLDVDELGSVFRSLGQNPTRADLETIVQDADQNGNGTLEEDEFVKLLISRMQTESDIKRDLEEAFDVFDRNGDGQIDKNELMQVLRMTGDALNDKEAKEMMSLMGDGGDGLVTKEQFTNFLCSDLPRLPNYDTEDIQPTEETDDNR